MTHHMHACVMIIMGLEIFCGVLCQLLIQYYLTISNFEFLIFESFFYFLFLDFSYSFRLLLLFPKSSFSYQYMCSQMIDLKEPCLDKYIFIYCLY